MKDFTVKEQMFWNLWLFLDRTSLYPFVKFQRIHRNHITYSIYMYHKIHVINEIRKTDRFEIHKIHEIIYQRLNKISILNLLKRFKDLWHLMFYLIFMRDGRDRVLNLDLSKMSVGSTNMPKIRRKWTLKNRGMSNSFDPLLRIRQFLIPTDWAR